MLSRVGWLFVMAWRDTRSGRARLLLFAASIAVGVASIVVIESFATTAQETVNAQAKTLVGADIVFQSRRPFDEAFEKIIRRRLNPVDRAEEVAFSSMVFSPKTHRTRLAQVRGLAGEFPFYGTMEVTPAEAREKLSQGGSVAIAEETLMVQLGAQIGDRLRLGEQEFEVVGKLARIPGESVGFANLAPRIFIPRAMVPETGLLQPASISRHRVYLKLAPDADVDALAKKVKHKLKPLRISVDTVSERKQDLGEAFSNVRRYLHLATVSALLLGGLGVASAVQAHIRPRLKSAAILRCLGATRLEAFLIYVIQAVAIALVGTGIGVALGIGAHTALPKLLADFITVEVVPRVPWDAVLSAACIGFVFALLFALLPMLQTRRVPPLQAIRPPTGVRRKPDLAVFAIVICLAAAFFLLLARDADSWRSVWVLAGSIVTAFVLLLAASAGVRALARRLTSAGPYFLRRGIANLSRPGNRTLLVMIVLGLGTQVVLTLRLSEDVLLKDALLDPEEQPNLIFFDIQPDQLTGVRELLAARGLPVIQESPMVTMRLASVKGRPIGDILKDNSNKIPAWVLQRDYRSSYREKLSDSERLISGEWIGNVVSENPGSTPVSIEQNLAKELGVTIGDELAFDVQGLEVPVRIASLRAVDWKRFQTNFFFVFPIGVLEDAPQFQVVVTRAENATEAGLIQTAMVEKFPNVSAFDLRLVIETIRTVVEKGKGAIQFMAGITILAGLLVLAGATVLGNEQRESEAAIFRALGASRGLLRRTHLAEDFVLGFCSGLVGATLAGLTVWALAEWVFQSPFVISWGTCAVAILTVSTMTVAAGFAASFANSRRAPLQVLRNTGF